MAKKHTMTLEKLARMVERGFSETATKTELRSIEDRLREIEERFGKMEKEMEYGFSAVAQVLKRLQEEIRTLDYGVEVHDLRVRVERVERKLGLKK